MQPWENDMALYGQACSFRRVMEIQPHEEALIQGLCYRPDGKPYIKLHMQDAGSIRLAAGGKLVNLTEKDQGWYEADIPLRPGYYRAVVCRDGVEILSPYLGITVEDNRPVNCLDIGPLPEWLGCKEVLHGDVSHEIFYSGVSGRMEPCTVYTPPGYSQTGKSYPVLYLQHGNGENELSWLWNGKINFLMDNLLAQQKAVPMIIVMANGMTVLERKPGQYELCKAMFTRQLMEDIIPFIEKKYRVKQDREFRAMAGLSMGSKQTSITVMTHLESFAWAGLFSGFMDDFLDDYYNLHLEQLLREKDDFNRDMRLFFRAIGTEDEGLCYFLENDRFCEENGIKNYRKMYEGGHDWNVWRNCAFDFLQMVFQERRLK
ncbi:alpha/beta hydrolase [Murimonas intestini]|uniref:Enterochelin esterase-like enzyme n=1 Tax=Murimonas intestini TaxID=1337051 RepID=A0AB73SY98_9FIRM|nr:alpha/beta hydrolase-fold protein [Murimonas intestini]MCR1842251.1 alpha/beta hydrolase-fold protein [Murimonas intestini]MCR1868332.1 alpha/beta hydrolase-fold protein [Murimonas intestini]MCR1885776.1 alpha/beta hydrolase-fold protein [Murimonas intestini]